MARLTATVPIVLVSSMAIAMNVTAVESASAQPMTDRPTRVTPHAFSRLSARTAAVKTAVRAPSTYRVVSGDTVSGIAHRFGLSTKTVLSLNGLSARSLIFPGQVLTLTSGPILVDSTKPLTPPGPPSSSTGLQYTIVSGDTIGKIAARYGVSIQSILTANGLVASSIIHPGQSIVIPGASAPLPAPAPAPVPASATADPAPASVDSPVDPPVDAPVVPPAETPTATPAAAISSTYVIQPGDNVTKIAARFGVSIQSILDANRLTRSSIIYVGASLTIPGVATVSTLPAGVSALSDEAQTNARTIIAVAHQLNVPDYGIVIALSAALQESGLRNLSYGDRDSVGLFQQRPSTGWGTVAQLTDTTYSTRLFFGGPTNPNRGHTRGLLDVAGWQGMTVTQAAQRVQISAAPTAYAKWEVTARYWLSTLG